MNLHGLPFRFGCAWLSAATLVIASARGDESAPASTGQPNEAAPATVASSAEITAWLVELEDNRYLVREQATRNLLEAGLPALDPLLEAVNGKGPERADRALWILRRFSTSKDAVLRRQALERLVRVKDRPRVSAAASQALAVMRHQDAVAAIEKLGGRFTSPQFGGNQGSTAPYTTAFVVLDNQWRGGDAGLAHLSALLGLQQVIIVGTDISLAGLAELQKVAQLERLLLYGTKFDATDMAKIEKLLPRVELDYRRGGLLGVGGAQDGMGPAVVATVQKGSAAEAVGVKPGDIIQQFNGQPVGTFRELTSKIGQLQAGDEVKLDVLREGKPIAFTTKLGQWQTF